jgi:hypothetical protein
MCYRGPLVIVWHDEQSKSCKYKNYETCLLIFRTRPVHVTVFFLQYLGTVAPPQVILDVHHKSWAVHDPIISISCNSVQLSLFWDLFREPSLRFGLSQRTNLHDIDNNLLSIHPHTISSSS